MLAQDMGRGGNVAGMFAALCQGTPAIREVKKKRMVRVREWRSLFYARDSYYFNTDLQYVFANGRGHFPKTLFHMIYNAIRAHLKHFRRIYIFCLYGAAQARELQRIYIWHVEIHTYTLFYRTVIYKPPPKPPPIISRGRRCGAHYFRFAEVQIYRRALKFRQNANKSPKCTCKFACFGCSNVSD